MSRVAWAIALTVAGIGGVCIGHVVEDTPLAFFLAISWGLMTSTIVAAVDESIRN